MHTDIPSLYRHHQHFGQTFEIRPLLTLPKVATIAPANIRTINQGKDWGVEGMRLPGMEDFCGRGFLTTDGELWQRSRKLLKPTFAKSNLQDLRYLSEQVDIMFAQIPQYGETVDMQPLLYDMVCFLLP
jgi:cytochrome P450